jgi:hypothetical protein
MRRIIATAIVSALCACTKAEMDTAVDEAVGLPCEATFTLTTPEGTIITLDECKHHGVDIEFATMEDYAIPQPHNLNFIFRSTKDTDIDCWVRWEIQGVCPDLTNYSFSADNVNLTWDTTGCDVDASAKGQFEALSGGAEFSQLHTENLEGLTAGSPMKTQITAAVAAIAEDGTALAGNVVIDETLDLVYTDLSTCAGSLGDFDGDGFDGVEFGGLDCDDTDATIGPHANEVCDGIDNNCDGQIDEDQTQAFYVDNDGDGWGEQDSEYQACQAASGDVTRAGDCDDDDDDRNPDATEACDGIDNDCDDVIDEGSKIGLYPDADDDGFGDSASPPSLFCPDESPEGFVASFSDCDDENDQVHPDAIEVCDGIDNDCDGDVDNLEICE